MIRQDGISLAFTVTALFLSFYWGIGEKALLVFIPALMIISGASLVFILGQHYSVTGGNLSNTMFYTLIAIASMYFVGHLTSLLLPQASIPLSGIDALQYGIIIAVAEENFFRGGLVQFLLPRFGEIGAILGSAAVFAAYHMFVYAGDWSAIWYVLGGGFVLAYVTVKSGSLTPSILAHVTNNILAVMWS